MPDIIWTLRAGGYGPMLALETALLAGDAPPDGNTATTFSFSYGSDTVIFHGDFTVTPQGQVTGGTINGFTVLQHGITVLEATGYQIAVADFVFALVDLRNNPHGGAGSEPELYKLLKGNGLEVRGSADGDIVTGTNFGDVLKGNAGNDGLFGAGGDDTILGGNGKGYLGGGEGRDRISGGKGNDVLIGGEGRDILVGGPGRDKFVFTEFGSANADKIKDFKPGTDMFVLDAAAFPGPAAGVLKAKYFATGKAKDGNDYIVYDKKTGALYYDADGSGSQYGKALIAKLAGAPDLSAGDIMIEV